MAKIIKYCLYMKDYKAILVGNGTMGSRHRAHFEASGVRFTKILDLDGPQWMRSVVSGTVDFEKVRPDFVVVASPASTHYEYAKFFLERKIPVFVEKPLATSAAQARELVELSEKNDTLLFVAQSECFNPIFLNFRKHFLVDLKNAVKASIAASDGAGHEPLKVKMEFRREHGYSERCRDVSVALDLLVHDLSLFLNMFRYEDLMVVEESACGCGSSEGHREGGFCGCGNHEHGNGCGCGNKEKTSLTLKVLSGEFAGLDATFVANRNSNRDLRTITVEFDRNGNMSGFDYTVSLARYKPDGSVDHIPDSLDNEHRFFMKLLAGACKEWGRRSARVAAQIVELASNC